MAAIINHNSKVSFICYHYIKRNDEFNRIWGHDFNLFKEHVDFLKKNYPPVSIEDLGLALRGKIGLPEKCSVITFDDGLKEHVVLGEYLAKNNVKAVFNVCSDAVLKKETVTAQAIHFGTAYFGVKKFAKMIIPYINNESILLAYNDIVAGAESKGIMALHGAIKDFFNKHNEHYEIVNIMRKFWQNELEKEAPRAFDKVFMDISDLKALIGMGHTIGFHTASHISFKHFKEGMELFQKEIVLPKKELEKALGIKIECFAYPFGKKEDVLLGEEYEGRFKEIGLKYIFSTYYDSIPTLNTNNIGRYLTQSSDSLEMLKSNLWSYEISDNHEQSSKA